MTASFSSALHRPSPPPSSSLNLATKKLEVLRRSRETVVDAGYLADPRAIEFPTEGGLTAHGHFYPPRNRDYAAPANEKPPLVVMSHGGPTSSSSASLKYSIQYWTSRGIAVLDVNYGGSSGYGREYRERLKGQWGIVDVDDCVNGARYLVASAEKLTATGLPSEAEARAATPRSARSRFATLSKPAPATMGSAIWKRWQKTPTSSSRAISTT